MSASICKVDGCTNTPIRGRRYCAGCLAARRRELYSVKKALGKKVRTMYTIKCSICGKVVSSTRKNGRYCIDCLRGMKAGYESNPYTYSGNLYKMGIWKHRVIAMQVLGRKLSSNEVVHHIDFNTKNNSLDNLIVMSKRDHCRLHAVLRLNGAVARERANVNEEDCWNSLIAQETTAWLATTGANVIKLSEIGQSAAEPLETEEGSETMHFASRTDDEIVQTTTDMSGCGNAE